jgi:hypothetical protein
MHRPDPELLLSRRSQWRLWFAWRPVRLTSPAGLDTEERVWLRWVERVTDWRTPTVWSYRLPE